jgi:hypothetical protein
VLTPAAAAPQDGVTSAATPAPGPSGPLPRGLSLLRWGPAVLRLRVLQRLQRHQQGKSRLYSDNLSTGTFMILHVETVFFSATPLPVSLPLKVFQGNASYQFLWRII